MKKFGSILLVFLFGTTAFAVNTSPSSLKIRVYRAELCTSGDCETGCFSVYSGDDYTQMIPGPELSKTDVPIGTYNCVRMELSDTIKFKPADNAAGGVCVADTEMTQDVNSAGSPSTGVLFDGTEYAGAAGEQKIAVYISTWSTNERGDGRPPTVEGDGVHGIKLQSPLVVTASTGGVFYLDGTDQVYVNGAACELEVPKFGFRAPRTDGT